MWGGNRCLKNYESKLDTTWGFIECGEWIREESDRHLEFISTENWEDCGSQSPQRRNGTDGRAWAWFKTCWVWGEGGTSRWGCLPWGVTCSSGEWGRFQSHFHGCDHLNLGNHFGGGNKSRTMSNKDKTVRSTHTLRTLRDLILKKLLRKWERNQENAESQKPREERFSLGPAENLGMIKTEREFVGDRWWPQRKPFQDWLTGVEGKVRGRTMHGITAWETREDFFFLNNRRLSTFADWWGARKMN